LSTAISQPDFRIPAEGTIIDFPEVADSFTWKRAGMRPWLRSVKNKTSDEKEKSPNVRSPETASILAGF